jgi:O-antigen/teichoic acid export membrane protein
MTAPLPWLAAAQSALFARHPLAARFARGAAWSLIGTGVAQGLTTLASIIAARVLGAARFGEYGMIQTTVGTFGILAGLGLGLTATKFVAEWRLSAPGRAGRILSLSLLVSLASGLAVAAILAVTAPALATRSLSAPHLAAELRLGCLLLLFNTLNGAQAGGLAGFEAFRKVMNVNIVRGLVAFPAILVGVWVWGVGGALAGNVLAAAVAVWLGFRALTSECRRFVVPLAIRDAWAERALLWRFTIPAFLGGIVVGPVTWYAQTVLAAQPGGYAELGVYQAVMQMKAAPEMIALALMAPVLPMLSEQYGRDDARGYSRTLFVAYAVSCGLLAPLALGLSAAPALVLGIYGGQYAGHEPMVQWLMFHSLLVALFSPLGNLFPSMNKMWLGFLYNLCWGALFLALSLSLVPRFLGLGFAAAFSLTHVTTSGFNFVYIYLFQRKFLGGFPFLRLGLVLASLLGAAVVVSRMLTFRMTLVAALTVSGLALLTLWFFLRSRLFVSIRHKQP